MSRVKIEICLGSSCFARGNDKLLPVIKQYIKANSLEEKVDFRGELCTGLCRKEPHIKINGEVLYGINTTNIATILDNYFYSFAHE
ncbi:(2Fe-2S) ferredoxin domain-containing protein [Puteibacter caeruleilacunae]|nr:(2Fe-2S) ferredoxin domain-containing protein [Puteibacter caeruleilacunae]